MLPVKEVKDQECGGTVGRGEPVFGGHDIRETAREGSSTESNKEKVKGPKRGPEICGVCYGVCCGAARELIESLSKGGQIGITCQVLHRLVYI